MDNQKRLLLAIGLSLGLTLLYSKLVWGGRGDDLPRRPRASPRAGRRLPSGVPVGAPRPRGGRSRYEVVDDTDGHLVFRTRQGPWELEKTFTWKKSGYELAMQVVVT